MIVIFGPDTDLPGSGPGVSPEPGFLVGPVVVVLEVVPHPTSLPLLGSSLLLVLPSSLVLIPMPLSSGFVKANLEMIQVLTLVLLEFEGVLLEMAQGLILSVEV